MSVTAGRTAALLPALFALALAMTACTLFTTHEPSPEGGDAAGGEPPAKPSPPAAPTPTPTPMPTVPGSSKSWTISADDFGGSPRSARYAWDEITADNADLVRVSIGGQEAPFTSTASQPAFASDTGGEWTVTAQVVAGAVVLTLTAPDQRRTSGQVRSVTITNPGSGYTSNPTVTFSATGGRTATGEARIDGQVTSVTVTAGGSGYTSAPTVTFTNGAGETAARGAAVRDVGVGSVSVTDPGRGYRSVPRVRLTGGGGSGAAAAAVGNGSVVSVAITNGGRYFGIETPGVVFAAPTLSGGTRATGRPVTREVVDGFVRYRAIASVTVTAGGSGYTSAPAITFTGASHNHRPAGQASSMIYTVASVRVTSPGSGYASAPTVAFDNPTTGTRPTTATGTAALTGYVGSVTITSPGSYQSAPTVTFSGGGGSGAAAAAAIAGGVAAVEILDPGSGYTLPPAVTFSGGGGSGAAATVTLATRTSGRSQADNLNSALRALDGKELVVQFMDA